MITQLYVGKIAIPMELTSVIILESHQPGLFFHVVLKFNLLQQAAGFGAQYDSDWKIGFSPVPREELWFTFASDFSYFKKIWRFLFRWAHLEWTNGNVNLQHVHILNPQASLLLGWSFDATACKLLKDFVGNRPVQTSQALAKPWQP